MRAIILAAGGGSRLLPLTASRPKCLVPVDGRAILDHQLGALAEAEIDEAVIVGGYRYRDIAAHIAGGTPIPVRLLHNPFWQVSSSIGSVWIARAALDDPFVLMNGDTIFGAGLLAEMLAQADGIGLLVEPVDGAGDIDDMRVAVADGRVQAVAKTLERADHRSLGVIVSSRTNSPYRAALDRLIERDAGPTAFHHAIVDALARDDLVAAIERRGDVRWQEIDRPEDIARWGGGNGG